MHELENISLFKTNVIVKLLPVYKERTMYSKIILDISVLH